MKVFFLSLVIVMVAFGCGEDDPKVIIYDESYFPLHVGDFWQYQPANELYPEMNDHIPIVTREITGTKQFGSHEYYKMVITYDYTNNNLPQPTIVETAYFRLGEKGFIYEYDELLANELILIDWVQRMVIDGLMTYYTIVRETFRST